jgi:hypothetical protein
MAATQALCDPEISLQYGSHDHTINARKLLRSAHLLPHTGSAIA